jgi:hypothetical protein
MWYLNCSMTTDTAAAEALTRALCRCPLLEELKLCYFYLGCASFWCDLSMKAADSCSVSAAASMQPAVKVT